MRSEELPRVVFCRTKAFVVEEKTEKGKAFQEVGIVCVKLWRKKNMGF